MSAYTESSFSGFIPWDGSFVTHPELERINFFLNVSGAEYRVNLGLINDALRPRNEIKQYEIEYRRKINLRSGGFTGHDLQRIEFGIVDNIIFAESVREKSNGHYSLNVALVNAVGLVMGFELTQQYPEWETDVRRYLVSSKKSKS